MPTVRTVTVKPSGGDYSSLAAAEAGEQGDLVSLDRQLDIECYAMSDTTPVTFDGWTTDATRYVRVFTPASERHDGKWNTSKYRLEITADLVISCFVNHIRFEGLQLLVTSTVAGMVGLRIQASGSSDIRVSNCIIRAALSGSGAANGVMVFSSNSTVRLKNCLIYDIDPANNIGMYVDNSAAVYVYNLTFHNCNYGIQTFGPLIAKNCLFKSVTNPASGTFAAGTDYNATDGASIGYTVTGGGNTHDRTSQTFTFINEASDDFHLASGDAGAKDFGVDLSADSNLAFSDDIDGATRSGSWDIGADEVAAAQGFTVVGRAVLDYD